MRRKQVENGNGMPKFTAGKSQKENPSLSFHSGPSFTSSYCFTTSNATQAISFTRTIRVPTCKSLLLQEYKRGKKKKKLKRKSALQP